MCADTCTDSGGAQRRLWALMLALLACSRLAAAIGLPPPLPLQRLFLPTPCLFTPCDPVPLLADPRNRVVLTHNAAVHILEAVALGSEHAIYVCVCVCVCVCVYVCTRAGMLLSLSWARTWVCMLRASPCARCSGKLRHFSLAVCLSGARQRESLNQCVHGHASQSGRLELHLLRDLGQRRPVQLSCTFDSAEAHSSASIRHFETYLTCPPCSARSR